MTLNYFENEISKSLAEISKRKRGFFYFRLFDTRTFRQISERIYALKQPCDFIALYQGKIYFLELKSSRNKTSFGYRYIKPHQFASLLKAEQAGARSYFLICNRHKPRHYKCYAVKASVLSKEFNRSERASIRWERLEQISLLIPRIKLPSSSSGHLGWDLELLFKA